MQHWSRCDNRTSPASDTILPKGCGADGGSWGDYPVMIDMLIAAIIMLLCMLTIPFIVKYFPLLIGLKRKV